MSVFFFFFLSFYTAVEKVAVICRFLDIHSVTKNHLLKYSLAHAFCCFLTAVEDVNPAVATRAGLLLDTIKRPALQVTSLGCVLCALWTVLYWAHTGLMMRTARVGEFLMGKKSQKHTLLKTLCSYFLLLSFQSLSVRWKHFWQR